MGAIPAGHIKKAMEDTTKRKSDSADVDDVRGIVSGGSVDMGVDGIAFLFR